MCRIAGILNPSLPIAETTALVKEMCQLLQHGGPDDEGIYSNEKEHLVLGNRRLALIDLSPGGHMPMSYADNRYWITYNGELYNYPVIKAELAAAGYSFASSSDTEVILAAFAAWGTNAFRRFNGMFAFALLDTKESVIYLVRDASGIKPLYYAITREGMAFASELRAFAPLRYLQERSTNWPVYLLAYGHLPEPITTLKEVKPLPKGSFLRFNITDSKWDISSFAFYNYTATQYNREAITTQIRESLQLAVQRHLLSDAPIGVFLSGGLDSSIIALLAGKYQSSSLKTLSIDFEEARYSEKKYQDQVIQQLNCPNRQQVLSEKEFHENFPGIISAMDLPGCDGINTWFISKYAKEAGLKAVLSGVGGDELFGGYPSFTRINTMNKIERIPSVILKAGRYAGSKKLRRLAYLSLGGAKGAYLFLRGQFVPSSIAKQLDASEKEIWEILEEQPELNNIHQLASGNQAGWIEMNLYMQNQLLRDSDTMSMAHGIEIRVPFLDREFVSLVMGINAPIKYAGELPKQLLIDSFKKELPEMVWNRPKMGFTFPFAEWLGKSEYVKDNMTRQGKKGTGNYDKFIAGQMHWSQLMSLLLLN